MTEERVTDMEDGVAGKLKLDLQSARKDSAPPVLSVQKGQRGGRIVLNYQLRRDLIEESFEQTIEKDPFNYFQELYQDVENLSQWNAEARLLAQRRLEGIGSRLAESLLPEKLIQRLASYCGLARRTNHPAQSLLLISDEPWIPWELLRLPGSAGKGLFLVEAFALTRWLRGFEQTRALPLRRIGLVAPRDSGLSSAETERQSLQGLKRVGECEVINVQPRCNPFIDNFSSGLFDGWHFTGHGLAEGDNSDLWCLVLEAGEQLTSFDLNNVRCDLHGRRPLIFLNTCQSARIDATLNGFGGLVQAFLQTGAGAVIGTHWAVLDEKAVAFAAVFYDSYLRGDTIGEASRRARLRLREKYPGNPAWLAYSVFAHPAASISNIESGQAGRMLETGMQGVPGVIDQVPYGLFKHQDSSSPVGRLPQPPRFFLGREGDLQTLKERLTTKDSSDRSKRARLLVMTGWPGAGKTTMTTAMANDPEFAAAFPDGILWTFLDQSPSLLTELNSWCIALGHPGLSPIATIKEASQLLGELLSNRQVLILVDDVWETAHAAPFLVAGPGCAMLVTSRLDSVAQQLTPNSSAVYRLPPLSEAASLDLLRTRIPQIVARYPEECRLLVRELEGLPLALHVAGRMLHEEGQLGWGVEELLETLREGRQILEQVAPDDRTDLEQQTLPTVAVLLSKSTERLSGEVLERFSFLGVFAPKPATFDLPAVREIWCVEDPRPTIRILANRGLLEPIGEGRFHMHALLIAHARSLLEEA